MTSSTLMTTAVLLICWNIILVTEAFPGRRDGLISAQAMKKEVNASSNGSDFDQEWIDKNGRMFIPGKKGLLNFILLTPKNKKLTFCKGYLLAMEQNNNVGVNYGAGYNEFGYSMESNSGESHGHGGGFIGYGGTGGPSNGGHHNGTGGMANMHNGGYNGGYGGGPSSSHSGGQSSHSGGQSSHSSGGDSGNHHHGYVGGHSSHHYGSHGSKESHENMTGGSSGSSSSDDSSSGSSSSESSSGSSSSSSESSSGSSSSDSKSSSENSNGSADSSADVTVEHPSYPTNQQHATGHGGYHHGNKEINLPHLNGVQIIRYKNTWIIVDNRKHKDQQKSGLKNEAGPEGKMTYAISLKSYCKMLLETNY